MKPSKKGTSIGVVVDYKDILVGDYLRNKHTHLSAEVDKFGRLVATATGEIIEQPNWSDWSWVEPFNDMLNLPEIDEIEPASDEVAPAATPEKSDELADDIELLGDAAARTVDLRSVMYDELLHELQRRGFRGKLSRTFEYEL